MRKPRESKGKGEIMRHAVMLVGTKGDKAVDHANRMAKRMEEAGKEEDREFWNKIAKQAELLIFEGPPE